MGIAIGALALAAAVQAPGDLETTGSATIVDLVPLSDGKRFCTQGSDPLCFEAEVSLPDTAGSSAVDDPDGRDALSGGTVRRYVFVTGPEANPDMDWRWPLVLPQWHEDPEQSPKLSIWPQIVELPAEAGAAGGTRMLIGVIATASGPYSGGGATSSRLHLYELAEAPHAIAIIREVLSLPWRASQMIRACFDEGDAQRRLGACHDEYEFGASLALDPDNTGGELPALIYRTQTTAFPQTARLWEDSSEAPPLTRDDLSHWTDFECSYQRKLQFNPASRRYEMDRPAPDCAQYTDFDR